ncbi:MAG: sigma-70 family RNA polymerase sigma factor [Clostridia bacterium]|nr:sigma-70 family RNA polymerase sigma factor [Clostridia bacterium]
MERDALTAAVTKAQSGDKKAINTLFNEYYNDIYNFARRTLNGNEDNACDAVQDTFVVALKSLGSLKEPASFASWLKGICYNCCRPYFPKNLQKKELLADEDEDGNTIFDITAEERTEFLPEAACDIKDLRETILSFINSLPAEQRAAVLMYYYEEMPVQKIAQLQGVSEGTVKSRLNYARKSMKSTVEGYERKHGVRLHSETDVAMIPMLAWAFEGNLTGAMPAEAARKCAERVSAETGIEISLKAGEKFGTRKKKKTGKLYYVIAAVVGIALLIALSLALHSAIDNRDDGSSQSQASLSNEELYGSNYYMADNTTPEKDKLLVRPKLLYWENGRFIAECYIINGRQSPFVLNRIDELTVSNGAGETIARAEFEMAEPVTIGAQEYVTYTFVFDSDTVVTENAALTGNIRIYCDYTSN